MDACVAAGPLAGPLPPGSPWRWRSEEEGWEWFVRTHVEMLIDLDGSEDTSQRKRNLKTLQRV